MGRFGARLRNWLAHPLTRGLDLDHPRTTELRRRIIRDKAFLRRIYAEWYGRLAAETPVGGGGVLELGSGAGFLREFIPELITSDVLPLAGVSQVVDAARLPFNDAALRGIVMTNVFHHLADPAAFLREAQRCLRPGGAAVMIEPWVSGWSRWVYSRLHHEPFDPAAPHWGSSSDRPLSDANGALPWIIFERDRERFERDFPRLRVVRIEPLMPIAYLLSGGVGLRALVPGWCYPLVRRIERPIERFFPGRCAMFAQITLLRTDGGPAGA